MHHRSAVAILCAVVFIVLATLYGSQLSEKHNICSQRVAELKQLVLTTAKEGTALKDKAAAGQRELAQLVLTTAQEVAAQRDKTIAVQRELAQLVLTTAQEVAAQKDKAIAVQRELGAAKSELGAIEIELARATLQHSTRMKQVVSSEPDAANWRKLQQMYHRVEDIFITRYPGWWPTKQLREDIPRPEELQDDIPRPEEILWIGQTPFRIFNNSYRDMQRAPAAHVKGSVAIVQVANAVWLHNYAFMTNSIACYAAEHGYHYQMDVMEIQTDRHIAQGRPRSHLKFLPFYEWIVHASADTFVANRSKTLEELGVMDRGHEVVLTLRNWWSSWDQDSCQVKIAPFGMLRQISTELYFVKNSMFERQFFTELLLVRHGDGVVFNMGDMHAAVTNLLSPANADECNWAYYRIRNCG